MFLRMLLLLRKLGADRAMRQRGWCGRSPRKWKMDGVVAEVDKPSLRAKRSNPLPRDRKKLDCFVASLLAMTARYSLRVPAARCARVVHEPFRPTKGVALPQGGSGECRVPVAPAAACAR